MYLEPNCCGILYPLYCLRTRSVSRRLLLSSVWFVLCQAGHTAHPESVPPPPCTQDSSGSCDSDNNSEIPGAASLHVPAPECNLHPGTLTCRTHARACLDSENCPLSAYVALHSGLQKVIIRPTSESSWKLQLNREDNTTNVWDRKAFVLLSSGKGAFQTWQIMTCVGKVAGGGAAEEGIEASGRCQKTPAGGDASGSCPAVDAGRAHGRSPAHSAAELPPQSGNLVYDCLQSLPVMDSAPNFVFRLSIEAQLHNKRRRW